LVHGELGDLDELHGALVDASVCMTHDVGPFSPRGRGTHEKRPQAAVVPRPQG
jgi:hypothetical protein